MKFLDEIINYESLTPIQLEKLSSHFNRYLLPRNKIKSRKHAFVCYTTGDREGAVVEAENLIDGLEVFGVKVASTLDNSFIFAFNFIQTLMKFQN